MKKNKFSNFYYKKKVLVTGHTGFVGSWLCFILKSFGAEIIGVSLKPQERLNNFGIIKIKKIIKENYFINILDNKKLSAIFKKTKPDILFHLAAQPYVIDGYKNPRKTIETNLNGTFNILESIKKYKVKQNVIITTDKVYENLENKNFFKEEDKLGGKDIYSSSKAACEIICESYFHSFLEEKSIYLDTIRAGNIIGGGDFGKNRIIPDIVKSIINNKKIYIRSPNSIRPWQYIFDICFGYLEIPLNQKKRIELKESWNLGPNKKDSKINVKKIVQLFKKEFKKSFLFEIKKMKYHESIFLMLDSRKSKYKLGWEPKFNFTESITHTIGWYKVLLNKPKEILMYSEMILEDYKKKLFTEIYNKK